MASSFISKDRIHGFWIHDGILQVVCKCMQDVIENLFSKSKEENTWLTEFKLLLSNNAEGIFHSYMHLDFDKWGNIEENRKTFMKICTDTKRYLQDEVGTISENELNNWYKNGEIGYLWNTPIEPTRLIKVIEYLEYVLNDKITITSSDKIDYSF